jgi:FOG: TPR repeat, SEL1 subfamily
MDRYDVKIHHILLVLICAIFSLSSVKATKRCAALLTQEQEPQKQETFKKRAIENGPTILLPLLEHNPLDSWPNIYHQITQDPTELSTDPALQAKVLTYFFHGFSDIPSLTLASLMPDLRKQAAHNAQALWLVIIAEKTKPQGQINPNTIPLIKALLKRKDSDSLLVLGECYHNGWGPKKNARTGFKYFELAAQQGDAIAQCRLGYAYWYGEGVSQNYPSAIKLLYDSASQGCARAQYKLGNACFYGKGIEQDHEKAFRWYQDAAKQGYSIAYHDLGLAYFHGYGTAKDHRAAFWYALCAEKAALDLSRSLDFIKLLYKPILTHSTVEDIKFTYSCSLDPLQIARCSAHLAELNRTPHRNLNGDQDTVSPTTLPFVLRTNLKALYEHQSALEKFLKTTFPNALSKPGLLSTNLTFGREIGGTTLNNPFVQYFVIKGQKYLCLGEDNINLTQGIFTLFIQTESLIATTLHDLNAGKVKRHSSSPTPEQEREILKQELFDQKLNDTLVNLRTLMNQTKGFIEETIENSTPYRNLVLEKEYGICFENP